MILHKAFSRETDEITVIKDELEMQETIDTLQKQGLQPDTYAGNVQAVRPPKVNYAIGHGAPGFMADQMFENLFAQHLAARGIQSGDELVLVVCFAGEADSVAQRLADELGKLGLTGVKVTGPVDFVHWTAGGPLLVKRYPKDHLMAFAGKRYTKVEDDAWRDYVAYLKAAAITATQAALTDNETDVIARVIRFAEARPDQNKAALAPHVNRATQKTDTKAALMNIIKGSAPNYILDAYNNVARPASHKAWSAELRGLLHDLSILADPGGGADKAAAMVTDARAALRATLAAAWPAYSSGYFERLRALITPDIESPWASFISAPAPTTAPLPQTPTAEPVVRTVTETQTAETEDINVVIDQWIRDLTPH